MGWSRLSPGGPTAVRFPMTAEPGESVSLTELTSLSPSLTLRLGVELLTTLHRVGPHGAIRADTVSIGPDGRVQLTAPSPGADVLDDVHDVGRLLRDRLAHPAAGELGAVLERATHATPAERFRSVRSFLRALEDASESDGLYGNRRDLAAAIRMASDGR